MYNKRSKIYKQAQASLNYVGEGIQINNA